MIDDIHVRAKVLSKACIKVALVLPNDKPMSLVIRPNLIESATKMTIKCKGLMSTQVPDIFLKNLVDAKEFTDGCNYWLEIVKEEGLLDEKIIDPIYQESDDISKLLSLAMRKVKPNNY